VGAIDRYGALLFDMAGRMLGNINLHSAATSDMSLRPGPKLYRCSSEREPGRGIYGWRSVSR